ncbi:MAG TPA: hypothetical protein VMH32_18280 [Burkholderiales bacterium]|nr:hypothetical protein [Burkholderiales bacterium]
MRQPVGNAEHPATAQPGGQDLPALIARATCALDRHCRAARQELNQTRQLLAEASRMLLDAFRAANAELTAMRDAAGGDAPAGAAQHPASGVSRRLFAASQHLQFPDLVGQLLATTEGRVDALLQMSEKLQALVRASATAAAPASPDADLEQRKHALHVTLLALESSGVDSAVGQSDMQAGEVNLFGLRPGVAPPAEN